MLTDRWEAAPTLNKIVEIVPSVIYIFNQHTQSSEYANRSLGMMLGYAPEEVQAMGDAVMPTLCHPDDLPVVGAHFAALQNIVEGEVLTVEYRMRHKDGHWVWLLSRDTLFERAEDGSVLRHIGVATDVTAQKGNEAALAAVNDELETVFNAASSGIIAMDAQGTIVRINNRARHMLGGPEDKVPFPWPEEIRFLDPETMQPLIASADPLQRALAGHTLRGETHLMRRKSGDQEARYVRVDNAAVHHNQSGIHMVLVVDDVSNEERNRQVIERKSRLDALGALTGGIAHDFNNLLASLLYSIDLATRTDSAERRTDYLETATASIQRGSALTARLLAFARRQPGLATVKQTSQVLEEFEKLVRPMLEAKLELHVDVAEPDLRHFCDQTQLETALMNLVLNARDAILRSGRGNRIEIKARPIRAIDDTLDDMQDGNAPADGSTFRYVEISVTDNGPGMNEETVARCTDPFFTTKDSNSGTGLGLAIVYGFTNQSDGNLRIYSEEGVGTTMRMTLPRGTELGTREEAMPEDAVQRGNGERILVVEDEFVLLKVMTDVLEDLDYDVITATSGQQALDIAKAGTEFDLLLTDVVMPGKFGGFELARSVRELRPDLPVIYTSGYTGFTSMEMGEVQAVLLQKPTPPADLARAIADALGQKKRAGLSGKERGRDRTCHSRAIPSTSGTKRTGMISL